jgi:hypothetical protein
MNREIKYDRLSKDFAGYINGILIGFYRSYHDAEVALDAYVFEALVAA